MKKFRHFTLKERELIEDGIKKGFSSSEIARDVSKSQAAIYHELRKMGGRANYNASGAHALSRKNHINAEKNLLLSPACKLKNRVTSLEMQVKILSETIKELVNDRKNH